MKKLILFTLAVAVFTTSGYWWLYQSKSAAPSESEPASQSADPKEETLDDWQKCTNTQTGFEVSYPPDWFTNDPAEAQACLFFSPVSFSVPKVFDSAVTPISILVLTQKQFNDLKTSLTLSNENQLVLSNQALIVGGKQATRVEVQATGTGLAAKDSVSIYYLLEEAPTKIIIKYQENTPAANREELVKILGKMVASFEQK